MNIGNHKRDSTSRRSRIDEWVLESCFLDILTDEEEPGDLDTWASARGWSPILTRARAKKREAYYNKKGNTYWSFTASLKPDFKNSELRNPQRVADYFLTMKAARARAMLECNKKRYNYAQSNNGEGRGSVRKAVEAVNNTLDAINLDCLAAFGIINRDPEKVGEEWRVLAALFHSEACASGTTADVSYGMARAFDNFFPPEKKHRWTWLFRLISINNQGRGLNHQRSNYYECIRFLVQHLEIDFYKDFDNVVEEKYRPLAVRLVFFSRVFILAEALEECHRKAEAAWWLKQARDKNPELSKYWHSRIEVELFDLESPGTKPGLLKKPIPPKLMNENQKRIYLSVEKMIADDEKPKDIVGPTLEWSKAIAWTIRWHEADHANFLGTVQGVSQSIQSISAALRNHYIKELNKYKEGREKRSPDTNIFVRSLSNIKRIIIILQKAILEATKTYPNMPQYRFLSPDNQSAVLHLELAAAIKTWNVLRLLIPALTATIKFQSEITKIQLRQNVRDSGASLSKWSDRLKERLKQGQENKSFEYVAHEQRIFELLQNPEELCGPGSKRERKKSCNNEPNCAEKLLTLGESTENTVTSTKYLLTRMSRFEAKFTRFLQEPSLEHSSDPKKPGKIPVTPLTEFVSLKRWSSFSPNLASHGTTTVGGGYLLRVWDEERNEYIGIAIDPGYNYLENLFDEGFALPDMHVIAVTHAHPDHVENLSNILTLLREREKRIKKTSRVFLVLTEGVFHRFKTLIDNEMDYIHDVIVLSWDRPERDTVSIASTNDREGNRGLVTLTVSGSNDKRKPDNQLASIKAVRAIHSDGTEFDSMGMVISVVEGKGKELKIGFTGDTRYSKSPGTDEFANCCVLVPHLGSVIKSEAFKYSHESDDPDEKKYIENAKKELQPTLTEKNHLYLPGISMLMCDIREAAHPSSYPLIILSEFGEELRGGLRTDLADRLKKVFRMTVLPADVGLRVGVKDKSVRCAICRQYVHAANVRPVAVSDEDEALLFVCDDCRLSRQHEFPVLLERLRKTPHDLHPNSMAKRGSNDGKEWPDAALHPPKQS